MRIDTQKQTLSARDDSIKKLLEMLQTKGEGKEEEARVHQQMQMVAQKQVKLVKYIGCRQSSAVYCVLSTYSASLNSLLFNLKIILRF